MMTNVVFDQLKVHSDLAEQFVPTFIIKYNHPFSIYDIYYFLKILENCFMEGFQYILNAFFLWIKCLKKTIPFQNIEDIFINENLTWTEIAN